MYSATACRKDPLGVRQRPKGTRHNAHANGTVSAKGRTEAAKAVWTKVSHCGEMSLREGRMRTRKGRTSRAQVRRLTLYRVKNAGVISVTSDAVFWRFIKLPRLCQPSLQRET